MKIKGTAVKSIPAFVKKNFPDKYEQWLESLPEESKFLFSNGITTSHWYLLDDAAITPTSQIGKVFYNDPKKGAWESGRYSAEEALNGIYKLYVKFSSPGHIIERAGRVFSAYYEGSVMTAKNKKAKSVDIEISVFDNPHEVIEYRIAGWMEKALEISGCKALKIDIKSSMAKGDSSTLYNITWN